MWLFWTILALVGIALYTWGLIQEARNPSDTPDNDWYDLVIMSEDEDIFSSFD